MSNIKSLRDHVCNYISEKIQSGELEPHQKLNEAEICEDLNISRTPAREALIILASDNLIEYSPRKGFYVKEVTKKDKLDHYALVGNLDAFAAVLAVDLLTDKDILKMEEIIANMDVAIQFKNYASYTELQNQFHSVYINKSDNSPLIRILHSLENSFIPITYTNQIDEEKFYEVLTGLNNEHKHIVQLFKDKNKVELDKFIKEIHWQTKHEDLL